MFETFMIVWLCFTGPFMGHVATKNALQPPKNQTPIHYRIGDIK